MASIDWSAGQRICDETDAPWPVLALAPRLPALDVVPAEVPLPVAAPVAPTGDPPTMLLVLCAALPPAVELPVALFPAPLDKEFVPVAFENVLVDESALLPA